MNLIPSLVVQKKSGASPFPIIMTIKPLVASLGLVLAAASFGQDSFSVAQMKAEGRAKALAAQPIQLHQLIVFLRAPSDRQAFARDHGMVWLTSLKSDERWGLVQVPSVRSIHDAAESVRRDPRIWLVEINQIVQRERRWVPNDPYFPKDTPSAGRKGQWHLVNQHGTGIDANVWAAWGREATGSGVVIGICDDGLQTAHPDLSPNYSSVNSWDFGQNDGDPNPVTSLDVHGTAVAGVAGARGGNSIGVTGAAPLALLAGLRLDFESSNTLPFIDVMTYRSSGANTQIKIKNHSYGASSPFQPSAAESAALATSANAGTIHVIAAGNSRGGANEDANKAEPQNSPHAIVVSAMTNSGTFADYSDFGSNIICTAPSDGATGFGILTTDRTGDAGYNGFPDTSYTDIFGGTSSASPLVAGVAALVKQVQPSLNARFFKHLLVRTSRKVHPGDVSPQSDGGWKTNGAGYQFNQNYGFGLIDANALTQQAALFSGVTALETRTTGTVNVNAAIPDNNLTGISRTFTLSGGGKIEEVLVTLQATHTYRGDLEAVLTSPAGTSSRVFRAHGVDGGANLNWTFCMNTFWGESPNGTWTLTLKDTFQQDSGTWTNFAVTARVGDLVGSTNPLSGTVTLGNFSGNVTSIPVTFELLDTANNNVLASTTMNLGSGGAYVWNVSLTGTYHLRAKASHWLRRRLSSVNVVSGGVTGLNMSLVNGDVNNDNSINVTDFLQLRAAFGSSSGSGNWNPNADLNGDGSVNVTDFLILRANFGQTGQ